MNATHAESVRYLRGPILRSVSRSFYLSIRLLPRALRDPVALAYLLARATDTIADTAEVDVSSRLHHLTTLSSLLRNNGHSEDAEQLCDSFAPLQKRGAERRLIEALPFCLSWLNSVGEADRQDIRNVLATVTEGQRFDLEHFGGATEITALQTETELDRYTYLVAGCVGEFWTTTCFRHLRQFATLPSEKMLSLGMAYGKGLQLINVLRDVGPDLRAGRCYLPAEQLRSSGILPADLPTGGARVEPLLQIWRARATTCIAAGVEYSCAIQPWRVRLATVLPALIGARTLVLLEQAGPAVVDRKVKMSRTEVRSVLLRMIGSLASPRAIRKLFEELSSRTA